MSTLVVIRLCITPTNSDDSINNSIMTNHYVNDNTTTNNNTKHNVRMQNYRSGGACENGNIFTMKGNLIMIKLNIITIKLYIYIYIYIIEHHLHIIKDAQIQERWRIQKRSSAFVV